MADAGAERQGGPHRVAGQGTQSPGSSQLCALGLVPSLSISLSVQRNEGSSVVTCSTLPSASHHIDGETEAQKGDRAPNMMDVVGGGAQHHGAEALNLISVLRPVQPGKRGTFRKRVSWGQPRAARRRAWGLGRQSPSLARTAPCRVSTVHPFTPTRAHTHMLTHQHTQKSQRSPRAGHPVLPAHDWDC